MLFSILDNISQNEPTKKDGGYSLESLAREIGIPKDEFKRIQSQKITKLSN